MATDYYGVLGLARGASDSDIKKAYRRLARDLHPDVNPDPGAKERFQEVSRAYQALTDPEKRRIVDLGGDPFDTGGGGGGASPFGNAGFGGLGDIMDAFFGGGGGMGARGPRSRARAGGDALIRLDLDLDETVFGTTKDITVDTAVLCDGCVGAGTAPGTHPTTCATCAGRGEVQSVQRSFLGRLQPGVPHV
jgi:molecular chaperone DnaJ